MLTTLINFETEIKHYLINNISIFDEWNIKLFKDKAEEIIDKSKNQWLFAVVQIYMLMLY